MRGRQSWGKRTEDGMKGGIEYFQKAVGLDPSFALAYSGIADCYNLLSSYLYIHPIEALSKAKAAAEKALSIDETLAEAHTSMAWVKQYDEWDWQAAENEYKKSIELNPSYATAHMWYSDLLFRIGRKEESFAEIEQAQQLDPLSLIISTVVGLRFYWDRQYDQALIQVKKSVEKDPDFQVGHLWLAYIYSQMGHFDEAVRQAEVATGLPGGNTSLFLGVLGYIHALSGEHEKAEMILEELSEMSAKRYVSPYYIAVINMSLGHNDVAFDWLEKAYNDKDICMTTIKIDPILDPLRSDSRFRSLLKKMNLD
ncbi:tetratricopeptide repeat protein [Acidobacteriota bacterium]